MIHALEQFLLNNKANFMIKYDPVREKNCYTIMLFDTVKGQRIIGGDTSFIVEAEQKMIRDVDPSLDFTVINDLFFQVIEPYQDVRDIFVLISINFVNGSLEYGLLVSGDRNFSRHKFSSCEELAVFIKNEDTAPNI